MIRARVAALAVLLLLGAGCSSFAGLESTGDKGYITGEGQLTLVPVAERGEPVELTSEDLGGAPVDLADLRGQVVVVNLWWSLCPPCRVEQPELNDAAERLDGTAAFLGINSRDNDVAQAEAYVRRFDVPYPSLYQPDGAALLAFDLSLNSIPTTVVLDREGRVAARILGRLPSTTTLVQVAEEVAAEDG